MSLISFIITMGCHAAGLYIYSSHTVDFPVKYNWELQFLILFFMSVCVALIQLFVKNIFVRKALYIFRFILLLLLVVPLGGELITFRMILFLGLLFSIGLELESPINVIFSIFIIIIFFLLQQPLTVLSREIAGASNHDLVAFGLISILVCFLSCSLNIKIRNQKEQNLVNSRLKNAVQKLSDTNLDMQNMAFHRGRESRISERMTISRELHDSSGYILTTILMMLKTSLLIIPEGGRDLRKLLENTLRQTEEGMVEIRSALHELRKKDIQDEKGIKAIIKLISIFSESTGVKVVTEYGDVPNSFGNTIDLFLYRFIQEGLINAFRHGNADEINITFWKRNIEWGISMHDNGTGCKNPVKGIGISGMSERAEKLKGKIEIIPTKFGFKIQASIPDEVSTG
jgi:signal transduction histidine kinase